MKLIGKREIAEGTMEFTFTRPEGFVFEAGQTIDMTLINPSETDTEGNRRTFSIASPPHESDIRIATRIRDSAFKRVLKDMKEGTEVTYEGPFGSFLLHENAARPAVFLSGGIGITLFHSMVADAIKRNLPHRILLFYSNRRPEDAAYLDELTAFENLNKNFKSVATMTGMGKSGRSWSGENGYVNAEMLARYVPKDANAIYYLAGPQRMVLALRNILIDSGVSRDDIRYEEFAGY